MTIMSGLGKTTAPINRPRRTTTMCRILFLMLPAAALSAQNSGTRVGLEMRGMFQFLPEALGSVPNIPAQFRTIPGHSEDPNSGVPIVVPSDTISPGMFTGLYAGVAPQIQFNKWALRVGPMIGIYSFPQPHKDSTGNTREINQYGTQMRGTGTSLVYYSVVPRARPFSGVYVEAERNMGAKAGLIVGYSWTLHDYTVKTGYDRFDALEGYGSNTLASASMNRFYGGARIGPRSVALLVLAGAGYQQITPATSANMARIDAPSLTPFFSIGITAQVGGTRR